MTDSRPTGAALQWDEQGQPCSTAFGDVYFSRLSGIDESRYVFLQHNGLPQRWRDLGDHHVFTIAETGFGTGLNFLVAWQAWMQAAPASARLHFVSVEKHPLDRCQLEQALKLWPELQDLAQMLVSAYPPLPARGFRRLVFDQGRVMLTLIFADVVDALAQLLPAHPVGPQVARLRGCWGGQPTAVDAWFLDGFAPARNPAMWSADVIALIGRLSKAGTTFATFTAAGAVKRRLQDAGFDVTKESGFGQKRHMLRGLLPEQPPFPNTGAASGETWHLMPALRDRPKRSALVIGAGLAGAHTARALAVRGFSVTVLEAGQVASGASGNRQGVVYARLSSHQQALTRFNLLALQYACRYYSNEIGFAHCGEQCGVVHLAQSEKERDDYRALARQFRDESQFLRWLPQSESGAICGLPLASDGLLFPAAGWLDPAKLCRQLLDHPAIETREHSEVHALQQRDDQWQAQDASGATLAEAAQVVIATAHQARKLPQAAALPLRPIRGQTSIGAATADSSRLSRVVCGKGYVAPAREGLHSLGATFHLHEQTQAPRASDDEINRAQVSANFASALSFQRIEADRVGFRCASPDYLPLVGAVPDTERFLATFAPLRRSARTRIDATGRYHTGLFVNVGHGSRGLAYTPLSAELLACMMTGEPLPLEREMATRLHPARFFIRDLKRNRR